MPHDDMGKRRRKGLSMSKAKKILHEGLSGAGGGFYSDKQRRFIAARASGQPMKRRSKSPKGKY